MTTEQIELVFGYLRAQYPGIAWNLRGDVIEQAEDDTPRVTPVPLLADVLNAVGEN